MESNKPLLNPLEVDIVRDWLDDDNVHHELNAKAGEVTFFTPPQHYFMTKHVADAVLHTRGVTTNWIDDHKEIVKEITDIKI